VRGAVAAALVAVVATACVPPPPQAPTIGAELVVSTSVEGITPGSTVTVTGTGFTTSGNLGTRPPFFGQPAGVYVVFARVTDPWKPSDGGPSANRQILQQFWALPQAQYDSLGGAGTAGLALMSPDGAFSVELTLGEAPGSGRYAIITYAGSGAVNAGEEFEIPVTFTT
jgi:hypothetical protein